MRIFALAFLVSCCSLSAQQLHPGARTVMDAHNCYPYFEWWGDRIDRALSAGNPLGGEQDFVWGGGPREGERGGVVSHGGPEAGGGPSMREEFFLWERALC